MSENKILDTMWDDNPIDITQEANFIWSIANKLRGSYMPDKYGDVVIPMTILRRFECALEATKQAVLKAYQSNPNYPSKALCKIAGFSFYNTSEYDLKELCNDSKHIAAILSCVIDGIEEKLYLVERTEEKVKKAAKTGVNTLAKLSTKIEKLKAVIEGIKTIIKDFHNPIDTEALGDFKSYQKLLKATKEILNEITQAGEYREKQTKLVILVDEIDRCLPDEQLKILERLHHLFDVKNCAVIVTMNQICVAETVKTIYGIDGYEYLRKFFNFTFRLDTSANEYLKNLLEEYIKSFEKIQGSKEEVAFSVELAYECLICGKRPFVPTASLSSVLLSGGARRLSFSSGAAAPFRSGFPPPTPAPCTFSASPPPRRIQIC